MKSKLPPKKMTMNIIESLRGGTVPNRGIPYIAIGREDETLSFEDNLDRMVDGQGTFRFIVGHYGFGKTFLKGLFRENALEKGFVVMDTDLDKDKRLCGSRKEGLNTYRGLIEGMSIKTKPTGGAMETVLQNWIHNIQETIADRKGIDIENVSPQAVRMEILDKTFGMRHIQYYSDFIDIVTKYWYSYTKGTENNALKWLKGEYEQRSMARKDLDIGIIIDGENWYNFIRVWAQFVKHSGYKGLIVFLDQSDSIYKSPNPKTREMNYEKILYMYNDIHSREDSYLSIFMCETPQSLEDVNKGVYSNEALRTRIEPIRFYNGYVNQKGPVITLKALSREDSIVLVRRLRDMYDLIYNMEHSPASDELVERLVIGAFGKIGANEFMKPRIMIRTAVDFFDSVYENGIGDYAELIESIKIDDYNPDNDVYEEELDF